MLRDILEDIVEAIGPLAVKALAAAACVMVFAPLVVALLAPVFG